MCADAGFRWPTAPGAPPGPATPSSDEQQAPITGSRPTLAFQPIVTRSGSAEQVAGVLVYLVYAPLWYGNADYLRVRICHFVDVPSSAVHAVVLDAAGVSDIDYTGL
jgi:MFS superfamily sulfate permease-like transporter